MSYRVRPSDLAPATPPMPPAPGLPRVCVIGAGPSGLAAVKALHAARVPVDCFELGPVIGGNWVFDNPNGISACYRGLEINTSCSRMAFSDFPMPSYYPAYARHWEVRDYFERYADHFGFRSRITFGTRVEAVERAADGTWAVRISGDGAAGGEETREYDAVLVANGHHWSPRWPQPAYPGCFAGRQLHAHEHRDAEAFAGLRVLVVGMGNSAMDIAVESSYLAASTVISVRRGQWVLRKTLKGRAVDTRALPARTPWPLKRQGYAWLARRSGDLAAAGLPVPDHRPGESHPVQSDRFYDRLADGRISPCGAIDRLVEDGVVLRDGRRVEADVIVWCTGYDVSFPFLGPELLDAPGNELPLYRRVVHPDLPGLFFVGLLQPLGAVMPLAEAQSRWVAELLTGAVATPSRARMRATMLADHERQLRRFYASPRHTMEVDFDLYLAELRRERRRGAARARRLDGRLAFPPRAVAPSGARELVAR